jgi:TP901 family phage tail tape measure protein
MTTQGGGNSTPAQVDINYTSTGYAREIENLKKLEKIIGDIKEDLGKITLPQIKGLKGALTEIESLRHAINTLQAGGQKVAPQDVVTKKAYHTGLEEGLKLQRQEAELTKKQLQNKAYLGILTKDEIKEQSKNLEYLKAINKGLEQRQQAGHATDKTLKTLVSKHIKSLEEGIKLERETQNRKKLQERVEQQVLAKRYAREAVEGKLNKADLKSQIAKSDLTQLRAFERAMNAEKLKAGYIETPQVKEFNKQVSDKRKKITAPEQSVKASEVVTKINAGNFTQAEVNHAITQLRKQLTHATNTGADRKTLVDLHQDLLDVRKAAFTKFTPQSPYQVAKELEETKAKAVLTNRLDATSVTTATKAQIQEQLKASEVMGHKTKAPFGSKEYDQEKAYQELLRGRLQIIKQLEAEASVKGTIYRDSLGKIKSGDVLGGLEGLSLRQLKKLQTQLLSHLDLTGLDTKVKENFKRALVQIDGTLKSAKRGELNLLGLEAPDTSKPLKRDKQLNIFEKARQGQLSIKDLQDFQVGSTDPKRTLKELRAIQNQIRKAELDPNLITTTDKAPEKLGNFIRTQISSLNQVINDLDKAAKVKDWTTQTRESVRADINTLGQSGDPTARQNIRDAAKRNFQTKQNQEEYNKELIRHKASVTQATIQQMTTSTELAKATKAIQLDNKLHPKNQEANLALTEAIKQRTKDLNYQARLRDPNFKASEDLKQNQTGLRTTNVSSLLQGQDLSSARQVAKVNAELEKQRAIQAGIFDSKDKLLKLSPEEHKFAKATLNYQYAMNQNDKVKREEAARLLNVLSDIEKANRRATAANQNLANLAHKYNTVAEIKNLKTKEEAELARKVVGYRMRTQEYDEKGLRNQQKLLDAAKRQDQLLGSRDKRQDKEVQHEKRLTQLTHLEGDGGASMAIVQAGFMMRSQVLGGLSSIFSGAFDSAIQLDKAFRNLQAISASTNYEMATMKVNLINVAQASKFSAAEVGETAVMLAQAGLSIQEIGASMKGIITLAQATGTDLAKSVDVVTSVLSIFNKSATETDTIVNQLTAALNESKLDINKMALGLQYAGNIASDSGVSFEELTAALGATANAGIRSGSTLGTGLRQMFIDLQKPNEKLTKRLETLGITLDQVSFRSQGLEGVLRNLRNAGFSSADAFETFEVRSAAAFSALSGNLTDFHDLQEELLDTNAAFEANNVQMESFAVQIDHLKSNLGIVAAEGLTPVLSLLRDFAKELAHVMENAEEGSTVLRVLTTSFAALTVGVTIAWFAKLVWHIGTTTAALMGLGRAVSLTTFGWVGLVAAIITGLAAWESATAETARLNTELDEAKGKYNDLKAALSSYGSELTNVDGAIKDLIDRYGVLSADTTQTEAVTKSLMSQFEQLGLVIDDVGSKHIDTILQKMRELRAEMAKKLLADTYETAAAEENKLYKELTAAHKTIRDNPALSTEDQALYVKKIISAEPKDLAKYEQVASAPAGKAVEAAKFALQIRKSLDSKEVSEELRTGFKELLQGLASTFEYSGKVPFNVFSAARTEYQIKSELGILQDKVAKRKLEQQLTKVMKQIEAVERTFNNPERLEKLRGETDRAAFKIQAKEIGYQPDKLLGLSQNLLANFNKELKGVSDQNHPIDLKRQLHAILAEEYLDQSGQYIEAVKKVLVKAKEQGKSSMFIAELERQIGEASEMQHNYRKVLIESNKKLNKIRLNTLNEQLKEAEAALKFAEEDFKLSTGSRRADGKYKVVQQKRQTVNELRRNILKLKLADNPESEETLESFDRKINSEAKSHSLR